MTYGFRPPKILIYASAVVWMASLTMMGVGVPQGFLRPTGNVALFITVVLFVYSRWGWAWVPTSISGTPDLRGTWRGTLKSSWVNPETGASPGPIDVYFVIAQTSSDIVLSLFTKESRSVTLTAKLEKRDGHVEVVGVYRNEPEARVRVRSQIHYGGLLLRVGGPPATSLKGTYWTDRLTRGDLAFELGTRLKAADFDTAAALCASKLPILPAA